MKGIVYCIECNDTGDKYIGSTIKRLIERIWKHTSDANLYERGIKNYCSSYPIIKNGNYKYYPLEELEVETRKELGIRERHFIENTKCVNHVIPTRSKKESDKAYREGPKREHILQQKREYGVKNFDKIKEHATQLIDCECGIKYQLCNKARHLKTLYHRRRVDPELQQKDAEEAEKKRERRLEYNKKVIECSCGVNYTRGNKLRHLNSQYHKDNYIEMS
jgi:hypothetical protein